MAWDLLNGGDMDPVILVYGFAFFALALALTIHPTFHSNYGLARRLRGLALFAALHGTCEWLGLWHDPVATRARLVFLVGSLLALADFAVEGLTRRAWARVLFLAVTAPALGILYRQLGVIPTEIAARYGLGLFGGIAGAATLIPEVRDLQTAGDRHAASHLSLASIALAVYGVFMGAIVPRADFFPVNWLNQDAFLAVTGVPVQIFRAVCAGVLAYGLIRTLSAFDREVREHLEQARAQLEQRVEERTVELQRANTSLAQEITQRQKMEGMLRLQDRMATMGMLAAGVAHEINNPLAFVLSNLSFLKSELGAGAPRQGVDWTEISEVILSTQDGAGRIRRIVQDLKTFARPEAQDNGPVDVDHAMDFALRMAAKELRGKARVMREPAGELPRVVANEGKLVQVFLNLLVNAGQAIPEGAADQHQIRIATHANLQGWVEVEVADTGSGIPAEHLQRIFEPFFTTKPVGVGTGLGLPICQTIIQQAGGVIQVESTLGQGTTFRVLLPGPDARPRAGTPPLTRTAEPVGLVPARGSLPLRS